MGAAQQDTYTDKQTILRLGFPSLLLHRKQFAIFQMCAGFVSFSLWAMAALPKESKISITVSCGGGRWIRKSVNQFGGTDNIYYALEDAVLHLGFPMNKKRQLCSSLPGAPSVLSIPINSHSIPTKQLMPLMTARI